MSHSRVVGVLVSAQDYEAMRAYYADRLQRRLDEAAEAASQAGLTADALNNLLSDES
jgi:PHD/YefM family antitoxin component YafN of YafNO toxin-antitoxin module